jgi:hypothetical protein
MTAYEAYHLAHRDCHVQQSLTGAQNTDNLTPTSGSVARHRSISQCIDEQINQWRSGNNNNNNLPIFYPTADQNMNQPRAIRAKLMIDAFSLYLLPVLFALLGSLVALNRDLRRVTDQWRLSLTERARGNTSLVLGAAFGAIVS